MCPDSYQTLTLYKSFTYIQGYYSQDKKIPDFFLTFPDEIAVNMSNKCTFINQNSLNITYQVSYFVELPQSHFPDYTNSLTFP